MCHFVSEAQKSEYLNETQYYGAPPLPGNSAADAGVPIDGGLTLLVAAGVAYGVKKNYKYYKDRIN